MDRLLPEVSINQQLAWDFALAKYKRSEIDKSCLQLQDEFACNVNLVLFFHYLGSLAVTLLEQDLKLIIAAIAESELTLKKHREVRRKTKTESPELYSELLAEELSLEREQHKLIVSTANTLKLLPMNQNQNVLVRYLKYRTLNDEQVAEFCDILAVSEKPESKA